MESTNTDLNLRQPEETKYVLHRRFDRMGRLIGDPNMQKLFNSHVMIIGIGGVGSWAAESLARSGIGQLTLVDFDEICITNGNRQLHALQGLVGKKKAVVMSERLRKINPQATVTDLPIFYSAETSEQILSHKPDFVIDCIDNMTAKSHLIATCKKLGIPVIASTGASAKLDPSKVKVMDLSQTFIDPMAHQLRKILRSEYGFPEKGSFEIPCVFSDEAPLAPEDLTYDNGEGFKCVCPQGQNNQHSCDRRRVIYGTSSFVTGTFGLFMAAHVVEKLIDRSKLKTIKEHFPAAKEAVKDSLKETARGQV